MKPTSELLEGMTDEQKDRVLMLISELIVAGAILEHALNNAMPDILSGPALESAKARVKRIKELCK